ncbi:MAG TPA: cytochrome P460 family protein [Candidatus Eisenbacteria bacterium]|nr:cytochrome P460 family protein [Candidatus Eisenbacteria bacterium]
MKLASIGVVLALIALAGYREARSQVHKTCDGFDLVDKSGNIRKPVGYRDHYQILGTFTVLDAIPMASGSERGAEIHYTYASPGTAEYYRKTGQFPDGAVLVKEVFGSDHGPLTTGDAHWASGTKQWFVMIKDAKGRFPQNPLWSDGWGWALFKPDSPDKQIATGFAKDCQGCHIPASSTDWVYVQGYPVLSSK